MMLLVEVLFCVLLFSYLFSVALSLRLGHLPPLCCFSRCRLAARFLGGLARGYFVELQASCIRLSVDSRTRMNARDGSIVGDTAKMIRRSGEAKELCVKEFSCLCGFGLLQLLPVFRSFPTVRTTHLQGKEQGACRSCHLPAQRTSKSLLVVQF